MNIWLLNKIPLKSTREWLKFSKEKFEGFSGKMAYPPNAPQFSRKIHQRNQSSPRSPSSTIQPSQTVLPAPGPSIVPADNNSNWEDAPTTNPTNTITANRPTLS